MSNSFKFVSIYPNILDFVEGITMKAEKEVPWDLLSNHLRASKPVWPDWATFWCLWQQLFCPKSPTSLGNFRKAVEIFHFSGETIFGKHIGRHLATFYWSHCSKPKWEKQLFAKRLQSKKISHLLAASFELWPILKMGHSQPPFNLFWSFLKNINFYNKSVWKNIHIVSGTGIRTHGLLIVSLLP